MAELVEHGGDVVETQQRRLAGCRPGVVADIEHDRARAGEAILFDERVHPGAAALARALVVVGIEQGQLLAVGIEHVEHAHVGLVDRQVVAFLEGQAVELVGGEEDAVVEHAVEFEVRLDRRFVEIVFGLAHLVGVEIPVRRGQAEAALLRVDHGLDAAGLAARTGGRRRHHVGQQLDRRLWRLRHLVFQRIGGEIRVAEQLRAFGAQGGETLGDGTGVVGIALARALLRGLEQGKAGGTVGQRAERRLLGGVLQGQQPLAVELALLRRVGGDRNAGFAEAIEPGHGVDDQGAGIARRQQPVVELRAEARLLLVEFAQAVLLGRAEFGAGPHEVLPGPLDEEALGGIGPAVAPAS